MDVIRRFTLRTRLLVKWRCFDAKGTRGSYWAGMITSLPTYDPNGHLPNCNSCCLDTPAARIGSEGRLAPRVMGKLRSPFRQECCCRRPYCDREERLSRLGTGCLSYRPDPGDVSE